MIQPHNKNLSYGVHLSTCRSEPLNSTTQRSYFPTNKSGGDQRPVKIWEVHGVFVRASLRSISAVQSNLLYSHSGLEIPWPNAKTLLVFAARPRHSTQPLFCVAAPLLQCALT
jgi:hypothetical protein